MFEDMSIPERLSVIEQAVDAMLFSLEFYDDPEYNEELGPEGTGRQLVVDSVRFALRTVFDRTGA